MGVAFHSLIVWGLYGGLYGRLRLLNPHPGANWQACMLQEVRLAAKHGLKIVPTVPAGAANSGGGGEEHPGETPGRPPWPGDSDPLPSQCACN
jgi:hypothetical protein